MRRRLQWHHVNQLSPSRSGQLKFNAEQLARLSSRVTGRIVLPQDAAYNSAREGFVKTFQHYPQIIVYAAGFSDVVAAINFAREVELHPVCRSGGHSVAGYSVNDEMVIDVSGIAYVRVDARNQTALVGAGANFALVNANLDLYGLHVPGGGCDTVGVAGYMQGGGYGFTSQMFGMNCDQVIGVQMALADGRIVTAEEGGNEDLYWAVRGGTGNNFGALLEIQYRLRELGPLWGFGFKWPLKTAREAKAAAEAATVWQAHFTGEGAPANLGHQALLICTKNPGEKELSPYFVLRGMFHGPEAGCRKALQPLLALMRDESNYRDIWRQGTYHELDDYLLSYPTEMPLVPASVRSVTKSHIVDRHLTAAEWSGIVDLYRASPSTNNFIGLEPYGGAINAVAPEATAFWHRRATTDIFLYAFWLYEHLRQEADAYVKEFDRVVQPLSNGHSYQNYPHRDNVDFGRMYFGGNLGRLLEVKRKYDPDNLFTYPQGLGCL